MSKKHLWIVFPLVILAGTFWLNQPNNSPHSEIHIQGLESAPRINAEGGLNDDFGAVPLSGDFRPADEEPTAPVRDVYGGGVPFSVFDLPDCPLRRELESLPLSVREVALKRLSEVSFPKEDLDSLHVDRAGMPYYVCTLRSIPTPEEQSGQNFADPPVMESAILSERIAVSTEASPSSDPVAMFASVPVSSPPIRHSKPGASRVLFLDFNGHVVVNTRWNSEKGISRWDCLPYDTDNDPATFSDAEQQVIIQVWERVAEDYAPFDVNVTTEQPAIWSSTTGHALFTPDVDANGQGCPHQWYGGIAYLNVFGQSGYSYNAANCSSPVWINTADGVVMAESASHELGHNLGLSHDGTTDGYGYYPGHGAGDISWGAIMGNASGRNVSQWSKGEYYDANNQKQDDLAIIAAKIPYRIDDHGNTNATATSLGVSVARISASGIITSTGDVDVFSFYSGVGAMSITVFPYRCASGTHGGNLDVVARLYNSNGLLLQSNNISTRTEASINYTSTVAGVYYLHISGTGTGDPLSDEPSGYTAYGSIGQYFISGEVQPATGIVVRSPSGGEIWYRGQNNVINWVCGADVTGNVKIDLYCNGTFDSTIAGSVANTGSYTWTIPSTQPFLTNLKIRVSSVAQPSVWDESDGAFSVASGNGFDYEIVYTARSGAFTAGDYRFDYSIPAVPGGAVHITKYTGSGGDVNIPSTIDGKPVYAINNYAFQNCTNLTGITMPNGLYFIGHSAFSGCANLIRVTIPDSVVIIECSAFYDCVKLFRIAIPGGVARVPYGAFSGCISLTDVTLIEGVKSIDPFAFRSCLSLATIVIPNSVNNIHDYAFYNSGLFSIAIPDSVIRIGARAFSLCDDLIRIVIGSGVDDIGDLAFDSAGLKSVYFNGNAPAVGADVFGYYSKATVYYREGTTGWGTTFAGRPTAVGCLLNITGNSCGRAYAKGSVVTSSVSSPVTDGGTRYVCTGWTMTGNLPLSGTATSFSMTLTNNATLTWRWSTNYYLTVVTPSNGTVDVSSGWKPAGSIMTITADPDPRYRMGYWLVNGAERNKGQLTLALTSTAPLAVEIFFQKNVAMPWLNLLLE